MIMSEKQTAAVERKQRICDRYKGADTAEVEVIPAKPTEALEGKNTILRVAAYVRVSTDNDEQLTSYELQKNYYTDYRICFEGITLYVFDLLVPEIFHEGRQSSENGVGKFKQTEAKAGTAKKGFYPDDIAGTFGVPVEQHALDSEIRQMDGYVTSGMLTRQNS